MPFEVSVTPQPSLQWLAAPNHLRCGLLHLRHILTRTFTRLSTLPSLNMLARITGTLESLEANTALITIDGGLAYEVLVPAFLAERLSGKWGGDSMLMRPITLHTLQYLESLNQGSSFVPRLIGFTIPSERDFFELLTTVKGLGNKRALRAMTIEPSSIARSIHDRDTRALQRLPEIGPKLAELIVHELKAKVAGHITSHALAGAAHTHASPSTPAVDAKPTKWPRVRLADSGSPAGSPSPLASPPPSPPAPPPPTLPPIRQAVETLIALGEAPADAERMVARAIDRARAANTQPPITPQDLLSAAYAAR